MHDFIFALLASARVEEFLREARERHSAPWKEVGELAASRPGKHDFPERDHGAVWRQLGLRFDTR